MEYWFKGSISKNLVVLLVIAILPALTILLYTGFEQRRSAISSATENVQLIAHSMAEAQKDLTTASHQILSTLALMPAIRNFEIKASQELFSALVELNPDYQNFSLSDLNGNVLAAALPFDTVNLADRKHVREALATGNFAIGEFILSRVGTVDPAFAFAYPVKSSDGRTSGILTAAVKLSRFADFHEASSLPEQSFIAVTDHQGIRLFYQPVRSESNPIGQPIQQSAWEAAVTAGGKGIYIGSGSDHVRRIVAFEPIILAPETPAYIYLWVGIPEAHILKSANIVLLRNLLLLFFAMSLTLILAWWVGHHTLTRPIKNLADLTHSLTRGALPERSSDRAAPAEIVALTDDFYAMATALEVNRTRLIEDEARFRLIMDSLDALVYVADMQSYEVLFINRYGKEQLGDVTGQICWQKLQKGQMGPCPFCTNNQLVDNDGRPTGIHKWEFLNYQTNRWFYIIDRAITWVDGRTVRLEIATDISARKAAEKALIAEKEHLSVTLKSIGDGVITTDTAGHVIMINPVAEELTGWTAAAAIGHPLVEVFTIINENTGEPCASPVEKVLTSGQIVGLANHTALVARDGRRRSIADSGAPIITDTGDIIGVVLVFRDVTEQQQLEEERDKIEKLEALGLLAGGIAHDFNNMLSAILGNIDLSLLDPNLADKTRKRLADAVKASQRARDLTRQLLTFAKGGQPIKQTAALPDVIRDSADFILHGGEVSCHYHFADDLYLVDIDKNQISQVIQNLILNAIQAMPRGGIIEVSCTNMDPVEDGKPFLDETKNYVKLQIRDQGEGIPGAIIDKVFDPYFSTKSAGSGLGLSIVHSIITKHDGKIQVTSAPGEGTLFSIYLPAATDIVPATDNCPMPGKKEQRNGRVLVMDDEESVRKTICLMLEEFDYETIQAADGDEAIRIYREELGQVPSICLVILDLTVPGRRGGKDVMQEFLKLDPDVRIVVSSGYSHDPIMANFSTYGFCAALAKPFDLLELSKVLNISLASG